MPIIVLWISAQTPTPYPVDPLRKWAPIGTHLYTCKSRAGVMLQPGTWNNLTGRNRKHWEARGEIENDGKMQVAARATIMKDPGTRVPEPHCWPPSNLTQYWDTGVILVFILQKSIFQGNMKAEEVSKWPTQASAFTPVRALIEGPPCLGGSAVMLKSALTERC